MEGKKMSTLYKLFQHLQGDMLPELMFMRPNPRIIKKQLAELLKKTTTFCSFMKKKMKVLGN